MTDITRKLLAAELRERRAYEREAEQRRRHWFAIYGNQMDAPRTTAQVNQAARDAALGELLPSFGGGGYAIAYYLVGDGDLTGDVFCGGCARAYLKANRDARLHRELCDGYEGNDRHDHLTCDDCGGVIAEAWDRDTEEDPEARYQALADEAWALFRRVRDRAQADPGNARLVALRNRADARYERRKLAAQPF